MKSESFFLAHEWLHAAMNTAVATCILIACYFIITIVFLRKLKGKHHKRRIRVRTIYILTIAFVLILGRIWIVGFTHLLAVLGLVSAALVITNKENIMNMVGYLIISWRGLFSEGDLIQIQQHKGYVRSLGLFYFALEESSELARGVSGRIIRIPNGLTAHQPLVNFSQRAQPLEQVIHCFFTKETHMGEAKSILKSIVESTLQTHMPSLPKYRTKDFLKREDSFSKVTLLMRPKFEPPAGIELIARYYCYHTEQEKIEQLILETILQRFLDHPSCHLLLPN